AGGLGETAAEPSDRAARSDAASSVAPISRRYGRSLRPCLGTSIAARQRAPFRQALLGLVPRFLLGLHPPPLFCHVQVGREPHVVMIPDVLDELAEHRDPRVPPDAERVDDEQEAAAAR